MMLNRLHAWVTEASQLTAIWRNANAPRPERPFISLYITGLNAIGRQEIGPIIDGKQLYYGQHTANVSIQCHESGDQTDPRAAVSRMLGLHSKIRHADLTPLSLLTSPTVINIPQILATGWEQQAVMDILVGFEIQNEQDMSYIERVIGRGKVITQGDHTVYTIDYDTQGA